MLYDEILLLQVSLKIIWNAFHENRSMVSGIPCHKLPVGISAWDGKPKIDGLVMCYRVMQPAVNRASATCSSLLQHVTCRRSFDMNIS
jgi:hypothetical protein